MKIDRILLTFFLCSSLISCSGQTQEQIESFLSHCQVLSDENLASINHFLKPILVDRSVSNSPVTVTANYGMAIKSREHNRDAYYVAVEYDYLSKNDNESPLTFFVLGELDNDSTFYPVGALAKLYSKVIPVREDIVAYGDEGSSESRKCLELVKR